LLEEILKLFHLAAAGVGDLHKFIGLTDFLTLLAA
jgi:hypothetical protein